MSRMIRVLIVEDQTMMRDALKSNLSAQEGIAVVGDIADAALAELYCQRLHPDAVLMDIRTENDSSGLTAAAALKKKFPEIRIIMMTGLPELSFIERARACGAESFIYKNIGMDRLVEVIERTCEGVSIYPHSPDDTELNFNELTRREREILRLICEGLSRKEIAERLNIAVNSVKTHFSNILSKTGFESVSKLAIYAVSRGLINTKI